MDNFKAKFAATNQLIEDLELKIAELESTRAWLQRFHQLQDRQIRVSSDDGSINGVELHTRRTALTKLLLTGDCDLQQRVATAQHNLFLIRTHRDALLED